MKDNGIYSKLEFIKDQMVKGFLLVNDTYDVLRLLRFMLMYQSFSDVV